MGSLCPFKLLCWELLLPLHLPRKEEAGDTLLETSRDALVRHQVYWHLQCGLAAPETQRSKRFSSPPRRWRQSKRRHFSGLKTPYHDSISWPGGASRHLGECSILGHVRRESYQADGELSHNATCPFIKEAILLWTQFPTLMFTTMSRQERTHPYLFLYSSLKTRGFTRMPHPRLPLAAASLHAIFATPFKDGWKMSPITQAASFTAFFFLNLSIIIISPKYISQ